MARPAAPMGRDGFTGLVVLAASLLLFWGTLGLERHPMVPVGPGFYPRIVLGITAGFALLMVVGDILTRRKRAAAPAAAAASLDYRLVVVVFGIFGAYVVCLPWLGFRVATLVFLVAMQAALDTPKDIRRWTLLAVIAIVATAVIYLVFERYLHVLMPRGRWTGF
jgi:hypothetical protein